MKRISIHLDESILQWIDSQAKNRSHFIRQAIEREYQRVREIELEILSRQNKKTLKFFEAWHPGISLSLTLEEVFSLFSLGSHLPLNLQHRHEKQSLYHCP